MIYLDHNATAPLLPAAREAMLPWLGPPANPMAAHAAGRAAFAAVDRARAQVAALADWPATGVIFTGSATEANATVLATGRWACSAVEHPSVLAWCAHRLPVDAAGLVRLELPEGVDGLSVMAANNETGVLQPLEEVAAFCRARGLRLHVDASQVPGRLPLRIDADFVTLSAHKMGGPTGVGALLFREAPAPLLRGGPQERGLRAGSHAVAAIVGMGAAAAVAGTMAPDLRDRLEAALGGRVAGRGAPRLPNTLCVGFDGVEAEDLVIALDLEGVAVSVGSACASGSPRPSHVLRAMGFPGSAVRFSLGPASTAAEVDRVAELVPRLLERLCA